MFNSLSEFRYFQSFRIPVEKADGLRFMLEKDDGAGGGNFIEDAALLDVSVSGLGFSTKLPMVVGDTMTISLQFKRFHLDLTGTIVRSFSNILEHADDGSVIYGVELDEDKGLRKFLENYILSFSADRLKGCLISSSLKDNYSQAVEGMEMFSLLLALFNDLSKFGDKNGFLENLIDEVVSILQAQRASIFLINPETNELEAVAAVGVDKENLKFDYRQGIAGSVFTTGLALNIDVMNEKSRFNEYFDKKFGFETKSIICHPIHNREDKIIGVIEVLNKRHQDRFSVEDEKTMKVLSLVFSSVFHTYTPLSESTQIRRFSTPFDRENALIGKTNHITSLRSTIIKIKDLDSPALIHGEVGVGKSLYAKIVHFEGQRGLKPYEEIDCSTKDLTQLGKELWGENEKECKITRCQGGSLVLKNICDLNLEFQKKLLGILKNGGVDDSTISFDIRVISTSAQDLAEAVSKGQFDPELYHYISKVYVRVESLRRRKDDIPSLVDFFLKIECRRQGLLLKNFSEKAMKRLEGHDWPGNILELKSCVERAVLYNPKKHVISDIEFTNEAAPLLDIDASKRIFGDIPYVTDYHLPLKERVALVEREMILGEIKRHSGNKSKAAKSMGISREALRKKMLTSDGIIQSLGEKEEATVLPLRKVA